MGANKDLLREKYAQFNAGDVAGATDVWPDDFVWEGPGEGLPGSGTHEGKQAALQVLGSAVGSWDKFALSTEAFIEDGDTVCVLGRTEVEKDGRTATLPVIHTWEFRDGTPAKIWVLTDTQGAAKVLGR